MPRVVDYLEFSTTDSIVWNDINFEGIGLGAGATAPDKIGINGSTNISVFGFDGNATVEVLYGGGEVLHDYKEGTDIHWHVHWMPTSTNTGNVEWKLEYVWANKHETLAANSTVSVIDASTGTPWIAYFSELGTANGTGKKIGSHVMFRLYRDPTSTNDTYPDDAALMSVGFHYQIDSVGSKDISSK